MVDWTPALVESRLKEAWLVLLIMPDPHRRYLLGARAAWPDCAREAAVAYGYAGDPGLTGKAQVRDPSDPKKTLEVDVVIPRDLDMTPIRARDPHEAVDANAAIQRMDEALPWLNFIRGPRGRRRKRTDAALSPAEHRQLVWRHLEGTPWFIQAAIYRCSEKTVQRWYDEALSQICDELVTLETVVTA